MNGGFNIWQLVAGIGIFLIGIQMLETALRNLMSRQFKLFLRKQTGSPFKAITGGAIATAILQSSSAVNFMILAFVSTGVITMRNALAVIMGTNVGTTLTSWIIATVGFKVEIETFAYPIVGIAGILLFIYSDKVRLRNICNFLIGFSFIFIGLGFMQHAIENEYISSVFSKLAGSSNIVFLLLGLIITTITQASSATVAITLSLLNMQLITFDASIAVVIGSEVGTSLKLILGSLDGVAVKKRVALGNFIYNIATTIIGFAFLSQIAYLITDIFDVKDPLIGLVVFQTGINLLNILIFLPFLNPFSRLLEKLFSDKDDHVAAFIYHTKPTVPASAIDLLLKECEFFIYRSFHFNLHAFDIQDLPLNHEAEYLNYDKQIKFDSKTFEQQYEILKQHHGEIQGFYIQLTQQTLLPELEQDANRINAAVRSCMHACKCVKDTHGDSLDLKHSSHDIKYLFYKDLKDEMFVLYKKLNDLFEPVEKEIISDELMGLLELIQSDYKKNLNGIYHAESIHTISPLEIATLININRELFTAHKAMVMSLKSLLLTGEMGESFSEIPTYQA